jgi:hypothetical protein
MMAVTRGDVFVILSISFPFAIIAERFSDGRPFESMPFEVLAALESKALNTVVAVFGSPPWATDLGTTNSGQVVGEGTARRTILAPHSCNSCGDRVSPAARIMNGRTTYPVDPSATSLTRSLDDVHHDQPHPLARRSRSRGRLLRRTAAAYVSRAARDLRNGTAFTCRSSSAPGATSCRPTDNSGAERPRVDCRPS